MLLYWAKTAVEGALGVVGLRLGEEPRYAVVGRAGPAEIRRYAPRAAAEVALPRDAPGGPERAREAAFRALFRYITGANRGRAAIAMTVPVEMSGPTAVAMARPVAVGAGAMRFFLPRAVAAAPPEPTEPGVRLVRLPEAMVAALRFAGAPDRAAVAERGRALLAALEGSAWRAEGEPYAMFYDPPFAIAALRRNEVAVAVSPR